MAEIPLLADLGPDLAAHGAVQPERGLGAVDRGLADQAEQIPLRLKLRVVGVLAHLIP
jgi:hypothetical protein